MRIGTYNVRNLFVADDAGRRAGELKPEKELKALAGTVDKVGADVWCLQEVGSREALECLNATLKSPFPHIGWEPGNSARGIHLAVLSRLPLTLTSHRHRVLKDESGAPMFEYPSVEDAARRRKAPLRFQRDVLLAEVDVDRSGTVAVFNTHLKSRADVDWRNNGADEVRAAEARELARILERYQSTHPERPVLLAGDFNDTRHSEALRPLRALVDPVGEALKRRGGNPSTYWPKRRARIDLILISPHLRPCVVDDSPTIHRSQMAERASDHVPVTVDLDLRGTNPSEG